jgi:hypothetical protein
MLMKPSPTTIDLQPIQPKIKKLKRQIPRYQINKVKKDICKLKINMKIEKKGTIKNEITKTDNSVKTSNSAKTYAETSSNQLIVNTDLLQDDEKKLLKQ